MKNKTDMDECGGMGVRERGKSFFFRTPENDLRLQAHKLPSPRERPVPSGAQTPTFLFILLLTAAALPLGCWAQTELAVYHPPPGVDVRHYDAEFRLHPDTRRLEGDVRLAVWHPDTLTTLPLAFSGMEVERVTVDGRRVEARRAPDRLIVPLPSEDTTSTIEISYAGVPETGLYAEAHEGVPITYTDSWPVRVRGWLPGVHHPSDPATLDLALTVPSGYEAVGTGEPVTVDTLQSGWIRSRWELEAAAPTYTYAFAAAEGFAKSCITRASASLSAGAAPWWPVCSFLPPPDSAQAARLRRTPAMLAYFSDRFGAYDFDRYGAVAVPFSFGGMENASLSFLRSALFDTSAVEATQAHEVAHQWFGDRVVIADWHDLWLSEGPATYLTTLFYKHAEGLARARRAWVALAAAPGTRGVVAPRRPVDPSEHLSPAVYQKAATVLHLLRLKLGDEVFFETLRTTYTRYAGRSLSTEAFKQVLEEVSGGDLTAFFDYWVYSARRPVLHTDWNADTRTLHWRITGDAGTLDGVPFMLQVRQDGTARYVNVQAGTVTLPTEETPTARPVGVMLEVD